MNDHLGEKEKKALVSLYKKDGLSYGLALCGIGAELVYVIGILDVMEVSFWMGITVMVNIMVLFGLFTCAVEMNIYDRRWAGAAVCLGVYMILRQLIIVPTILRPYDRQLIIGAANMAGAALLLTAGVMSRTKSLRREGLEARLKESDSDRGVGGRYGKS